MGCNSSKQQGYESQDHAGAASQDDPKKSAHLRADALRVAEDMMAQTRGRRFHEFYTRLTLTSYGASCKVLTAYHRTTNKKVAVKTIPKSRKQQDRQRQKVKLEIGTFRMVEDHPNAVKVFEIFEGAECYYIVMECCEGGELFDHISKKQGCFTERQAAHLLRSLMLFLAHMHSKGIAHMDIKPENIMFDSEGAAGVLKVLDFGSAVFVQPHETVRNAFGTVRYASPEMANDMCGQKADVWSAGVVMYILLCGRAPFLKSNDIDTLNLIKSGPRVKFSGDKWASISQSAKDCIRALLEANPRDRPTAVEVLAMPWLKQQVPETVIVPDTLQHLRIFANQSRIRRLLLGLMADQLVGSGANQLLGQFYTLDKDFSGTLEVSELVKAAQEAIPDLSEEEINRMFEALDVDRTGTVDVKEFFAGLIQTIDEEKQTLVAQKSFTMLDKRGSGYVTKEAFMEVLLERAQAGTLKGLAPKQHHHQQGQGQGQMGPWGAEGGAQGLLGQERRSWAGRQSGADGGEAQVILDPGLVAELEAEFANLDANGDGVLSFEEFKAILGIQSTPEGLTLTQPQLAVVPSIQEGMETLAQTLRTRTCSLTTEEQARRQASIQKLTRLSQGGGGGGGNGGVGSRVPSTPAGAGRAVTGGSITLSPGVDSQALQQGWQQGLGQPQQQPGQGPQGGSPQQQGGMDRASTGGDGGIPSGGVNGRAGSGSVERAQMDLELPYDLGTRDLLQLLAPAKRTASFVPPSHQNTASGYINGGGDGGGGINRAASAAGLLMHDPLTATSTTAAGGAATSATTAAVAAAPALTVSVSRRRHRKGSSNMIMGSAATPADGVAASGECDKAASTASVTGLQRGASAGYSRAASSVCSVPTMLLLDKAPSMRAPSLPPLPPSSRPFDAASVTSPTGRVGSRSVKERAWDGPMLLSTRSRVGSVSGSGVSMRPSVGGAAGALGTEEFTMVGSPPRALSPRTSLTFKTPQQCEAFRRQKSIGRTGGGGERGGGGGPVLHPLPPLPGGVQVSGTGMMTGSQAAGSAGRGRGGTRGGGDGGGGGREWVLDKDPLLKGLVGSSST